MVPVILSPRILFSVLLSTRLILGVTHVNTQTAEGKLYGMNEGPAVFDKIIEVAKRGVAVTIVENADGAGGSGTGNDTKYLVDNGFATVRLIGGEGGRGQEREGADGWSGLGLDCGD